VSLTSDRMPGAATILAAAGQPVIYIFKD
jgi:hypothetical protein